MNLVKRFGALLMATAVVLSTGILAVSADSANPVPSNSTLAMVDEATNTLESSSTYAAYKVITWDANYGNMKIVPAFHDALLNTLIKDNIGNLNASSTDSDILNAMNTLNANNANAAQAATVMPDIAVALKKVATFSADYTTTTGYFATTQNMVNGYYLILETANNSADHYVISKPMIARVPGDSVIYVKHTPANITKKIVDDNQGTLVDANVAALGDTVNYQSVATFPTYASDATNLYYYISDTLSSGLTLNASSLNVKLTDVNGGAVGATATAGTDYDVTTSNSGFTISVHSDKVKTWGNAGYELLITYSATLNADGNGVQFGKTGNPNTITLTYTNNPDLVKDYKTVKDTVITFTLQLVVNKYDKDMNPLANAKFQLYKMDANGNYQAVGGVVTGTGTNGNTFTFSTISTGSYKLVETQAPTGYNLMNDVLFNVTATYANGQTTGLQFHTAGDTVTYLGNDNASANVLAAWNAGNSFTVQTDGTLSYDVHDSKGFILPGSGGIGTYLFTAGGILILLAAGVLLAVYLKKQKNAEIHA